MAGFYRMPRGWQDNPIFGNPRRDPLCRRAAWQWLIEHAAFAPVQMMIEGKLAELARGELSYSIRDLGGEWGWPTTKVARFVSELFQHRFIGTRKIGRQFVISIENYEQFSFQVLAENRTGETKLERSWNDVAPGNKEINTSEPKGSSESETRASEADAIEVEFGELWLLFPRRVGKGHARKAYRAARKQTSAEIIRNGVMRFAAAAMDRDPGFVAHPATWLTGQRWEDEADAMPARSRDPPNGSRQSPTATLFEGGHLAAEAFIRRHSADIGPDFKADGPLLDGGRSGSDAPSSDRGLARRPH